MAGGKTQLGTVSRTTAPQVQSLSRRVSGEACSSPLITDDYRKATLIALSKAPGANVLTNVTMESRELLSGGFCLRVTGIPGVMR